jgi:hypothetical protein
LAAGAIGVLGIAAAGMWCLQNSGYDKQRVQPHDASRHAVPHEPSVGGHGQKIIFTGLGSFWASPHGARLVSSEFSDLKCHRRQLTADIVVGISDREVFLFENTKLPENTFSLDCTLFRDVSANTTPWIGMGEYTYHYAITDAPVAQSTKP